MDSLGLIDTVTSHAAALGVFDVVNGHEAVSGPGRGVTASYSIVSLGPAAGQSGLSMTSALVVFEAVIYRSLMTHPLDLIDPEIMAAVDALIAAYSGDFTLGGTIRNVDLLGQTGLTLRAEAGYVPYEGSAYRVMMLTIPLIINDAWLQAE